MKSLEVSEFVWWIHYFWRLQRPGFPGSTQRLAAGTGQSPSEVSAASLRLRGSLGIQSFSVSAGQNASVKWVDSFWHCTMPFGYGSIPIKTILRVINIHKSQLFWCELQGYQGFDTLLFFEIADLEVLLGLAPPTSVLGAIFLRWGKHLSSAPVVIGH